MSDLNQEPPFFIGWEEKPPAPISAFLKKTTFRLIFMALVVGGLVGTLQKTVTSAWFDFGHVREFSGVLVDGPAPMLVADQPVEGEKILYLVSPLKFGFPEQTAKSFHLRQVKLKGTFLGDGLEAMIEVVPESISSTGETQVRPLPESRVGETTLRGEIVDSKCHLGLMNPGRFKTHRACAIQCLSGGIPPILTAKSPQGQIAHYLLVGPDGSAVNNAVLDYVAEPVEVSGTLKSIGDRKVLYFDPASIKRL